MEDMAERIPDIMARLAMVESKVQGLDALWRSSVDDIKATIRSEISDLKSEQIADLRKRFEIEGVALEKMEIRLREVEGRQRDWDTGRRVVDWVTRFLIGAGALGAGYYSGKHL